MNKTDITKEALYIKKIKRVIQSQNRNVNQYNTIRGRHSDALVYILSGSCTYWFDDGISSTVTAGNVLYLADQSVYTMCVLTTDYRFIYCDFEFDGAPRKSTVYRPDDPADMETKFRKLLRSYQNQNERTFSQYVCALYEIYGTLLRDGNKPYHGSDVRRKIESAKSDIETGFNDLSMSVEVLACRSGMSAVYFRKLFKERYGVPPSQYLTAVRLKNAKELMMYPFLSLEECALQSGFSSVQYFCRVFKKENGTTPAKYRKSI